MVTCRRSIPTSATSLCGAATGGSTAGSSRRFARRASTAGRAARRSRPSARTSTSSRPPQPPSSARLPGVQAVPARRHPGFARMEHPPRRRGPGDAADRRRCRRTRRRGRSRTSARLQRAPSEPRVHRRTRCRPARDRPGATRAHGTVADRDDGHAVHRRGLRRGVRQRAPVQRHGPRGVRHLADRAPRGSTPHRGDHSASTMSASTISVSTVPPATVESRVAVTVRLAVREPFASGELLAFLGERAVPGVETWDGTTYRRSLELPGGVGVVGIVATTTTSLLARAVVVERPRRRRPTDPSSARSRQRPGRRRRSLGADSALAPIVAAVPGRRSPASVDPFETAVRAVIGQQVSVAGARTVAGRIVEHVGRTFGEPVDDITRVFPRPDELAVAPDEAFSMPRARRDTIRRLARAVADGDLVLDLGSDPDAPTGDCWHSRASARGPPTTSSSAVSVTPTCSSADLGVRHALVRLGLLDRPADDTGRWSPWRSYAVHHLWASLSQPSVPPASKRKQPHE